MKQTCYHCTHADFRAAHQDQKSGFAYCLKNEFVKAIWMAPQRECDKRPVCTSNGGNNGGKETVFRKYGQGVAIWLR